MTNPKAVLEARLRNFACLSKDDVIAIMYNNKIYEMSVLETKPANAVSVIGKISKYSNVLFQIFSLYFVTNFKTFIAVLCRM